MSEGMNKVILLGNLGADPELKMLPGGQAVLNLRLATTESYVDRNQTRQERTEWHSVAIWGKRGEGLSRVLAKGDRVAVEGRIQTTSYEKDGEKRYRTQVVATNVYLCGRGGGAGASAGEQEELPAAGRGAPPARGQRPQQRGAPRAEGGSTTTRGAYAPERPTVSTNDYAETYDDDIPF